MASKLGRTRHRADGGTQDTDGPHGPAAEPPGTVVEGWGRTRGWMVEARWARRLNRRERWSRDGGRTRGWLEGGTMGPAAEPPGTVVKGGGDFFYVFNCLV